MWSAEQRNRAARQDGLSDGAAGHRELAAHQRAAQTVLVQRPGEGHPLAVRTAHGAQREDLFRHVDPSATD